MSTKICAVNQDHSKKTTSCLDNHIWRELHKVIFGKAPPSKATTFQIKSTFLNFLLKVSDKSTLKNIKNEGDFFDALVHVGQNKLKWNQHKMETLLQAITEHFKPHKPKGINAWLSNFDINYVLEQYQKKHSDYQHLGTVPIDFAQIPQYGVHNEAIFSQIIQNGKRKLSIVYNTDPSYKRGQHWIASFIHIRDPSNKISSCSLIDGQPSCPANTSNKTCSVQDIDNDDDSIKACSKDGTIEFYDSVGSKMPKEVSNFLLNVSARFCNSLNLDMCILRSTTATQKGDGQCGVYCLDYITRRLEGESFNEVSKKKTYSDPEMGKRRALFMRPSNFKS